MNLSQNVQCRLTLLGRNRGPQENDAGRPADLEIWDDIGELFAHIADALKNGIQALFT